MLESPILVELGITSNMLFPFPSLVYVLLLTRFDSNRVDLIKGRLSPEPESEIGGISKLNLDDEPPFVLSILLALDTNIQRVEKRRGSVLENCF